jgi:hypothetical protein
VRSSSWNGGVSAGAGGELPDRRFGFVAMDFPLCPFSGPHLAWLPNHRGLVKSRLVSVGRSDAWSDRS